MGRIVFQNGRIFNGSEVLPQGSSVIVEGNEIISVGASPIEEMPGDRIVDLEGKTLMPGMVQCHFHTGFGRTQATHLPISD